MITLAKILINSLKCPYMMCNFCKLHTDFVMGFVKEKPMKGTYDLGNDSFISFYLAPRINDE